MFKKYILDTAASTFGHVRVYSDGHINKRSTHTKRPWFGIRQKHLRTTYLEAKTIYARNKTRNNKMRLINASKSYEKSILKKFHNIN